jgi:ABC-type transport system involved in cytochrome c biogenesis permease component
MDPSEQASRMATILRTNIIATGITLALFSAFICLLIFLHQQNKLGLTLGLLICITTIVFTCIGQLYLAVRLQIDRLLFSQLANNIRLHGLDHALAALDQFLLTRYKLPAHKANRSLDLRIAGTQRLCSLHQFCIAT